MRAKRFTIFFFILWNAIFVNAFADVMQERRLTISASLFPRIIAVDEGLSGKLDKSGEIRIGLIYVDSRSKAERISKLMTRKVKKIAGVKIVFSLININEPKPFANAELTGIFLVQPVEKNRLDRINKHCTDKGILSFSPFEGDIERGVMASIFVAAKIRPYFNTTSLNKANVNLKPALIKVSKLYE